MAKSGGSATTYGILYQALGTVGHALELTLRASIADDDIDTAMLVIEPVGGGGDLQIEGTSKRVVEQWKARSSEKAWTLTELIDDVFPDLYRATDPIADLYKFITEGKSGTMTPALDFFKELGPLPEAEDPASTLDDATEHEFAYGYTATKRSMFFRVAEACRRDGEGESESRRKTWNMLARFTMEPPLPIDELKRRIDHLIGELVDHIEDRHDKCLQLCGRVFELAAQGGQKIRAEDLLTNVGLRAKSFRAWHEIRERLTARTSDRIVRATGYQPELDARSGHALPSTHPVTLIIGESGQGKSWALAASAKSLLAGEALVVWVTASEHASWREVAARELWCHGLNHDQLIDLERVAERRKFVNPAAPSPWAVVCVDDVQSPAILRQIVEFPWEEHGMRMILSVPAQLGQPWISREPKRMAIVAARDFTPPEVRECLIRRGVDWAHDVREIIRRPVLSQVYCSLTDGTRRTPRHEYDLLKAYWRSIIQQDGGQPQDLACLRSLAGLMLRDRPQYPWSPETCTRAGASGEVIDRLVRAGWLRKLDDGSIEVWHDRLLCWAVAEHIIQAGRDERESTEWVCESVKRLHTQSDTWARRLGYVPMDVLFLYTEDSAPVHLRQDAWAVIKALEAHAGLGFDDESLYERLLPTLGSQVGSAIVNRLEHTDDGGEPRRFLPRIAAKALMRLGRSNEEVVHELTPRCINSEDAHMQELGLRLLARFPSSGHVDRCWELHRKCLTAPHNSKANYPERYRLGFAAVASCLGVRPDWIRLKIQQCSGEPDLLSELAYLLGEVQGAAGKAVWDDVKSELIATVPPGKRRCLAKCILSTRDHECVQYLHEWTQCNEEFVAPVSLEILSYFDPAAAAEVLPTLTPRQLFLVASTLREQLMGHAPEKASSAVAKAVQQAPDEQQVYLDIACAGDRISRDTVQLMIDWLDKHLLLHEQAGGDSASQINLFHPLHLVEQLWGYEPIEALRSRKGSPFESRLTSFVCKRADNTTGYIDHEFVAAFNILARIGGEGITQSVNALLRCTSQHAQMKGCEYAPLRPNAETKVLLDELAQSEAVWNEGKQSFPIVQQKAVNALAAIGEDAALIRGVMKLGTNISPDVADYREGRPSMNDNAIADAVRLLEDPQSDHHANAVLALGFSGRHEIRDRVVDLFVRSEPASEAAQAAMLALEDLGGRTDRCTNRLLQQYRSGHFKFPALKLFMTGDREESHRLMAAALPAAPPFDEIDQRIIASLGHRDETRPFVKRQLQALLNQQGYAGITFMYEVSNLLDPRDERQAERLWETATRPSGGFTIVGAKAASIATLATVDPAAAFEMASHSLEHEDWDRDQVAGLMLRLNMDRAVTQIVEFMVSSSDKRTCRDLALQLRANADPKAVIGPMANALADPNRRRRRAAAFASGFLRGIVPAVSLSQLSLTDCDHVVCRSSAMALRRQQQEMEAGRLAEMLRQMNGSDLWGVCFDVIRLADPDVLTLNGDPLGFLAVIKEKPFALRKVIADEIDKMKKKLEKDLKSFANQWDADD